jgi:Zn-dependent metalloprotease
MEERSEEVLKQTMEAHQANQVQSNGFDLENEDSATPVVYVDEELGVATKAFFVQFVDRTSDLPTHPHFILAENGIDVIRQWDGLQTRSKPQAAALASGPGGNDKIGRIRYDKQLVITDVGSGKCALENEQVVTVNLNNKKFGSKKPHQFKCYEQTDKEVNGAPSPMNDAHYYGSQVFEMYKQYYGTSPLKKTPLVLRVHYGTDYDNAFFKSGVMTFGDGGKRFYPLTALDVVAHEVSHGVTTQSSKLLYFGQSGGLNEAFSDMAGKAVQGFTRGYDSSFMWGLGSDISKNQRPLRCMDNPPCDGKSIDHVSKYRTLMNVHFSSGVYNKAFVELTKRLDSSKGLRIAFDVFYVANTRYWGRFTNFVKGAELTLKAAAHMKAGRQLPNNDYSQLSYQAIVDSFAVVGINCKRADSGRDDEWDCAKA